MARLQLQLIGQVGHSCISLVRTGSSSSEGGPHHITKINKLSEVMITNERVSEGGLWTSWRTDLKFYFMTMREIKEEDFDDFRQEYSSRPREDDSTSKEEMSPAIKMEEKSNVTENSHDGMTSIRKVSESSQLVTIKKEIKKEDVDDFLQEYLWQPRQDDSPSTTTCKEEMRSVMDIKEEEMSNVIGNCYDGKNISSKESESSLLVTYKKEIKREDFEDSSQRTQENDETKSSFYKEENCSSVDIKEEIHHNLIVNGKNAMSPTSKFYIRKWYRWLSILNPI